MTQPNEKPPIFKKWDNPYPDVHPSTSTEQILERIAKALENISEKLDGSNEKLTEVRDTLGTISVVIETAGGYL